MEFLRMLAGVAVCRLRNGKPLVPHPADFAPAQLVLSALQRFDDLLGIEKATLVTYPEAIGYFVTARPDDRRVTRGALVRRPDVGGSLLIWLFLDKDDEPLKGADGKLFGRKLIAAELDEELKESLGDADLLVVG